MSDLEASIRNSKRMEVMKDLLGFNLAFATADALVTELNRLFVPDKAEAILNDSVRIALIGQRYRLSIERQYPGKCNPNPEFDLRIFSLFLPVNQLGIEEMIQRLEAVETAHRQLDDASQIVALDFMGSDRLGSATDLLKTRFIPISAEKKAANG